MKAWKRSLLCSVAAGGMVASGLGVGASVAAPPTRFETAFTFNCSNGVILLVEASGKEKTIDNGGGMKILSPGLKARITNVTDPDNPGPSATYSITGTGRTEATDPVSGDTRYRVTGRNVLSRPAPDPNELYLVSGNFTYVLGVEDGQVVERQPFTGSGNITNLCQELA
ncbi:hypothetical protein ACH9D2_07800 [Kocuria sp. M4R2S49]|uniref:hypothetical protein n=1 Tax=Kocuria rhizosphaericola TaxID=3376284 RepID=UPI003796C046